MSRRVRDRRFRPALVALAVALLLTACQHGDLSARQSPPPAAAPLQDVFVVLSGGGTPTSNNYSQYVQARAVTAYLRARYPREAVWVFFGQGNRDGEPPVLADVYRQVKRDGLLVDTWLPGSLPDNRPATKENFLRTLREEILPRVRAGGTLHLFVGDHGELTGGKSAESAITMWGLKRDPARPNGWSTARDYALTVSELRAALADGLGSGRVVFAMTQCHSGGFHDLGVPEEPQPPAAWFASRPAWLNGAAPRLRPVAGFTATDEASIAAGCDPAPDPDTWAGYERFFPEMLLGENLLPATATRTTAGAASFAAAHHAAVLLDHTIDKPRATSEHFLERWATVIEERIARELLLAPRTRDALDAYREAVETGRLAVDDAAWRDTQAQFTQFIARMTEQNPALKELLVQGGRAELEKPPRTVAQRPARTDDEAPPPSRRLSRNQQQAWREAIRPAWLEAVNTGQAAGMPSAAVALEKRLHNMETRGRPVGFSDEWSERALTELYWHSTYATPETFDAATADAVTRWAATRRSAILAWAAASPDEALRKAAAQFGPSHHRPRTAPPAAASTSIDADTAAERTLFYRRVLAAWAFLLALDHQPALAELHALRELERTPLPAPVRP